MNKLALVLVVVAACAKKSGDCILERASAQQAIAVAKRQVARDRRAAGSNADALAVLVARDKLLDAWALAVTQPHPDAIAATAGGSDAPSSVVAARTLVIEYAACVN